MSESPYVVVPVTLAIIALSAYFVAVEFALISARRHRLEDAAQTSRSARAALRSATEITLLLAGSQLGITACTLALGAIAKPAVHHWMTPAFESWGAPYWAADAAGFVLALLVITFLHLVVGEMAPKSWAIAHPETSATMLALPMRGFMWVFRPVLRLLNEAANWCLHRVGVESVDEVDAGRDPDDLRQLVEHSADTGALDQGASARLSRALATEELTVADVLGDGALTAVGPDATVADLQEASRASGHLRILVGTDAAVTGVVHVRDTLDEPAGRAVGELARDAYVLEPGTTVHAALTGMRDTSNHLAVVSDGEQVLGVVTMADLLGTLFPV